MALAPRPGGPQSPPAVARPQQGERREDPDRVHRGSPADKEAGSGSLGGPQPREGQWVRCPPPGPRQADPDAGREGASSGQAVG